MKITLAYPRDGHDPDETIEVEDHVGRQLVQDGVARLPDPATFDAMKADELKAYAGEHGIDLGEATKKADIVQTIRAAEKAAIPPQSPITPVTGANPEGD